MADGESGLLTSFCKGLKADLAAVTPALTEPWSNGQTEGQITRLKLVKRQMYGRGRYWTAPRSARLDVQRCAYLCGK
jgi:transposase